MSFNMRFKPRECPNCGGSIKYVSGTYTCSFCGTDFDPVSDTEEMVPQSKPIQTIPAPKPAQNTVSNPVPVNDKRFPLTVIAAIAIGLIACTFIYSWFRGKDSWKLSDSAGYSTSTHHATAVASSESRKEGGDPDKSCAPSRVYLTNCEPWNYSSGGFPFYEIDPGTQDIFGNTYQTGFRGSRSCDSGEAYAVYRLDKEFSRFEFTVAVEDADRGNDGIGSISIYGDGVMLYSKSVTCVTETEVVSLDVSDVKDLTVEIYGSTIPEASIVGFASLWPLVADPILYVDSERGT